MREAQRPKILSRHEHKGSRDNGSEHQPNWTNGVTLRDVFQFYGRLVGRILRCFTRWHASDWKALWGIASGATHSKGADRSARRTGGGESRFTRSVYLLQELRSVQTGAANVLPKRLGEETPPARLLLPGGSVRTIGAHAYIRVDALKEGDEKLLVTCTDMRFGFVRRAIDNGRPDGQ
jgi:hypothetical protein